MTGFRRVRCVDKIDRASFDSDIRFGGIPVVLKGIAADWPAVTAAKTSPQALGTYLRQYETGKPVSMSVAPKEVRGRFFYNGDLSGLNYVTHKRTLDFLVGWCLAIQGQPDSEAVYLQALPIDDVAPGMAADLPMPLLEGAVRPRLWLGNTLVTQTHFDYTANIAVHVAGDKTFTLFPPNQTANLYPGPLDKTPAGVPVSMASLEEPDLVRYPRLAEALAHAVTARLEPGDGLFIPPLWWHHVDTRGPLNMLVNYWWEESQADLIDPMVTLNLAALAYKSLPEQQRLAWRDMLDYFVFETGGDPIAHLPANLQSIFRRDMSPAEMDRFKHALIAFLARG